MGIAEQTRLRQHVVPQDPCRVVGKLKKLPSSVVDSAESTLIDRSDFERKRKRKETESWPHFPTSYL